LEPRRAIFLLNPGGTINTYSPVTTLEPLGLSEARLTGLELLRRIPGAEQRSEVDVVDLEQPPRGQIRDVAPSDWVDWGRRLGTALQSGRYSGAIVTHGTNGLEETAYFLNLTLKTDHPVVVVGAMRPPSMLGTDADRNLAVALRVAVSPSATGKGVLVVMNDTIHAAREVQKAWTNQIDAFESRNAGPLGRVDPSGGVVFYVSPDRLHTVASEFSVEELDVLPRVDVVVSYPGHDGAMVDAGVQAGAQGIVVAGTGAGGRTRAEDEAIDNAIRRGTIVVISTRAGAGRVVRTTAFKDRAIIAGDNLGPFKARVLLMLALGRTRDPDKIQTYFDTY
jgi:L-asparaginase